MAAALAKAPGCELLSPKELELCAQASLLPLHFLAVKEALVREAYRNGSLTAEGVRRVVALEAPKAAEVFDLFVKDTGALAGGADVFSGAGAGAGTGGVKRSREAE